MMHFAIPDVYLCTTATRYWKIKPPWGSGGLSRECVLCILVRVVKGD